MSIEVLVLSIAKSGSKAKFYHKGQTFEVYNLGQYRGLDIVTGRVSKDGP